MVKLFPPEEPQLPGEGGSKEAQGTGFDKDPVECAAGADGNCQIHVATEDRALYGMPSTGANPGKTYRIDYDLPQTSGGVASRRQACRARCDERNARRRQGYPAGIRSASAHSYGSYTSNLAA